MAALARWAAKAGIGRLWVSTGERAVAFYVRCGFTVSEVVTFPDGNQPTVLVGPTRS
jgi:hypothetical protein